MVCNHGLIVYSINDILSKSIREEKRRKNPPFNQVTLLFIHSQTETDRQRDRQTDRQLVYMCHTFACVAVSGGFPIDAVLDMYRIIPFTWRFDHWLLGSVYQLCY